MKKLIRLVTTCIIITILSITVISVWLLIPTHDEPYLHFPENTLTNVLENQDPDSPLNVGNLLYFDEEGYIDATRIQAGQDPYGKHAFNQEVSDNIPAGRAVSDYRHSQCKATSYQNAGLPTTSVIICYHNEARSTLLRTVVSVLDRSPPELIKEIILVDDSSDDPETGTLV